METKGAWIWIEVSKKTNWTVKHQTNLADWFDFLLEQFGFSLENEKPYNNGFEVTILILKRAEPIRDCHKSMVLDSNKDKEYQL